MATISRRPVALVLSPGEPLPLLPEESAHSAALAARIATRARDRGGWLPFSGFMQAALYEPDLGYYMTDRPIFGAEGDFMTAPEMSPLFTRCLAAGIVDLLAKTGGGDIVEFGAGSGRMAVELVATLARLGQSAAPLSHRGDEPDPGGPAATLARTLARDRRPDRSIRMAGCATRRGLAGCRACKRSPRCAARRSIPDRGRGCESMGVVPTAAGFEWQARPAEPPLAQAVELLQSRLPVPMPEGFVSELRPGQRDWIAAATEGLTKGAMLLTDYGLPRAQYYHPSRDGGTLCGFRRHRRMDDVLAMPGAQDLTAWVDYSAVADAALALGLEVAGFATQAHYLLSVGIERELALLVDEANERERVGQRQAAATLLLPGEMGERFKVMALCRAIDGPVAGFGFRDLTASL